MIISFLLNHLGQGEKGLRKRFDRGRGGWGKELMIRATWRKGWVSGDEEGLRHEISRNLCKIVKVCVVYNIIISC